MPGSRTVTLRTVRRGAEAVAWPGRTVRVDPDVYAVAAPAGWRAEPLEPQTHPIAVELPIPAGSALDASDFVLALRPTGGAVGRCLRELPWAGADARAQRVAASALWPALLDEEAALRARARRIDCVKASTRELLWRRILASADAIQSRYCEPLRVDALAAAASLSASHFTRLFRLVMGRTPHAMLIDKRLAVARRLLADGVRPGEVAARVGFGARSTLFRQLRRAAAGAR